MVWDSFPVRLKLDEPEVSRAVACGCSLMTVARAVVLCVPCQHHAGRVTVSMEPRPDSLATLTVHDLDGITPDDLWRLATIISAKGSELSKGEPITRLTELYPIKGD
jgi:hypothetical protein